MPELTDPLYRTYTTNNWTTATGPMPVTNATWTAVPTIDWGTTYKPYATEDMVMSIRDEFYSELEKTTKRIYEIIKEHTNIDITEEEFMHIIKEG